MKKIFRSLVCLTLIFTMLFAACVPSALAASTTNVMRVNGSNVRLHYNTNGGGASTMITRLAKGTKVLVISQPNKSWMKVRLANGLEGYVYRDYLTNVNSVKKSIVYVVKDSRLPAYKTYGAKKASTTLKGGTMVAVGATRNGYSYVMTLDGKKYYVKSSGLKKLF